MPKTNELLYRNVELTENEVRKLVEGRTVPVSFSSESLIPRWFGREILSHRQGHVIKGRVKSTLFHHNPNAIVGPFMNESYENGKGTGEIQFDETPEGELRMKQVQSGSLRGVSVGYLVEKYKKLKPGEEFELASGKAVGTTDEERPTYVAVKWSSIEVSLTPIPADTSIGVGREATRSLEGIEIEETQPQESQTPAGAMAHEDRVAAPNNLKGGENIMEEKEVQRLIQEALSKRDADHKTSLQRIFDRGAAVGKTELALRMHLEGRTDDEITDAIIKEVAKERGAPKDDGGSEAAGAQARKLDTIDDETFIRGITSPSLINL